MARTYFDTGTLVKLYLVEEGVWDVEMPDWSSVWNRAAHLAKLHTRKILCRALDILHVAAAETCEAELVVTGDSRQFRPCKAVGLPVALVPTEKKK